MLVIIDYGMGNLGSVVNALRRVDVFAKVSSSPDEIRTADRVILPGIGSFDRGMMNLRKLNLIKPLEEQAIDNKVPILGICLGMQLFSERSEEGYLEGLGWIESSTQIFRFGQRMDQLKVPHMGWNAIRSDDQALLSGVSEDDRFYFVHSYHIKDIQDEFVIGTTSYGYEFPSVIRKDNIMGIQCHPERSHRSGLRILRNFMDLT